MNEDLVICEIRTHQSTKSVWEAVQ